MITKEREVSQIKPRLGQGRAGLRCKINAQITGFIVQTVEKPLKIPKVPKVQDKVTTIPNFAMPPVQSKCNSNIDMIDRKTIQDIAREIPSTQIQFTDPLLNQLNHLYLTLLEDYQTLTQK